MGSFLAKAREAYIVLSILNLSEEISTSYEKYVNTIQTNGNNTWTIRTVKLLGVVRSHTFFMANSFHFQKIAYVFVNPGFTKS